MMIKLSNTDKATSTYEALQILFQKGLTKSDVLDLSDMNPEENKFFLQAAKYYKRGLQTKPPYETIRPKNPPVVFEKSFPQKCCIVVDHNVYKHWRPAFTSQQVIVIDDVNESNKNWSSFESLCQKLIDILEPIFIVGGGIVCDMGAFACGHLGKTFHLVPTTFLAMVDAAIGGKSGVNFEPYGKNQVGLFVWPVSVNMNLDYLKTLDPSQFASGLSEAYKHHFLQPGLLKLSTLPKTYEQCSEESVGNIIKVKQNVVTRDALESGPRKTLNFGHSFGHALEALTMDQNLFSHGEAVAWGMVFANFLSVKLGFMTQDDFKQYLNELQDLSLLTTGNYLMECYDTQGLLKYFRHDKKNTDKINMVLFQTKGHLVNGSYTTAVSLQTLEKNLSDFLVFLENLE